MIPYRDHILPASETPFNKALAALSTRLEAIDAPTREVWDPWTCPPQFLAVLAHAFSVDLWSEDWSVARKRSIIANAVRMHREKGTLAAIYSYLPYVDARPLAVIAPPQVVYSGPRLTREQREAWLSGLPQVRTWRMRERGHRGLALHAGGYHFASFYEAAFPVPSTAFKRLQRRARWVVSGTETDTRVSDYGNWFRLHIKAMGGRRVFVRCALNAHYFQPSEAWRRIVTIAPKTRDYWRAPVGPHLEGVTSEPERIKIEGRRDAGVFCGHYVRCGYFRPSSAPLRIYWRFAVANGSRTFRRPAIQFMGIGRYGFPAHTAHVQLSMPATRKAFAAGEGILARRSKFWLPHDPNRTLNARRALIAAKRASDRLMIRYAPRAQIIAGTIFLAAIDGFVVGRPSQR